MERNDLFRRKELFVSEMSDSGSEIRAVPEGYHAVTPWIISRDTAGLIEFVGRAFGAEEIARVHNEDGSIGHAEFRIGDSGGDRVGRVLDSYGNLWWIQARIEEVDPAEMEWRAGEKEWIERMAYVQESLDRELGNRTR
jgi:PhnB protein